MVSLIDTTMIAMSMRQLKHSFIMHGMGVNAVHTVLNMHTVNQKCKL